MQATNWALNLASEPLVNAFGAKGMAAWQDTISQVFVANAATFVTAAALTDDRVSDILHFCVDNDIDVVLNCLCNLEELRYGEICAAFDGAGGAVDASANDF